MGVLKHFWFSGRVTRRFIWLAWLPVICISLYLVGAFYGFGVAPQFVMSIYLGLMEFITSFSPDTRPFANGVAAILYGFYGLVVLYCYFLFVTVTRRLHDRNKMGWWQIYLFLPTIYLYIFHLFTYFKIPIFFGNFMGGYKAAAVLSTLASVWFFFELGFFRGTAGPNRYGPDPLQTDEIEAE